MVHKELNKKRTLGVAHFCQLSERGTAVLVQYMKRVSMIKSMIDGKRTTILDVGCGSLTKGYPYARDADEVVCVDWKLTKGADVAPNIRAIEGNFLDLEIPSEHFDLIILADVFEHISIEQERQFSRKCIASIRPEGELIVSVPHAGRFAWLDPYRVKPIIHRLLYRAGLYKQLHNGFCDIRKGHKHYLASELYDAFAPLRPVEVKYWGYFFEPLLSWADSKYLKFLPGSHALRKACSDEYLRDYSTQSFNIVVKFRKTDSPLS